MFHHSRLPRKEFGEWGRFLFRASFQTTATPSIPPPTKKEQNIPPQALLSGRGADRAALAQPHVDDPWDTDLQGHEMHRKLSSGQDPVILEPQVQAKR